MSKTIYNEPICTCTIEEDGGGGGGGGGEVTLPTTTKGDLVVHDGSTNVRLPVGANNTVLTANSATTSGLQYVSSLTLTNISTPSITTAGSSISLNDKNLTHVAVANIDEIQTSSLNPLVNGGVIAVANSSLFISDSIIQCDTLRTNVIDHPGDTPGNISCANNTFSDIAQLSATTLICNVISSSGASISANNKNITNVAAITAANVNATTQVNTPTITNIAGSNISFSSKNLTNCAEITCTRARTDSIGLIDGGSISMNNCVITNVNQLNAVTVSASTSVITPVITTAGSTISFNTKNITDITLATVNNITVSRNASVGVTISGGNTSSNDLQIQMSGDAQPYVTCFNRAVRFGTGADANLVLVRKLNAPISQTNDFVLNIAAGDGLSAPGLVVGSLSQGTIQSANFQIGQGAYFNNIGNTAPSTVGFDSQGGVFFRRTKYNTILQPELWAKSRDITDTSNVFRRLAPSLLHMVVTRQVTEFNTGGVGGVDFQISFDTLSQANGSVSGAVFTDILGPEWFFSSLPVDTFTLIESGFYLIAVEITPTNNWGNGGRVVLGFRHGTPISGGFTQATSNYTDGGINNNGIFQHTGILSSNGATQFQVWVRNDLTNRTGRARLTVIKIF